MLVTLEMTDGTELPLLLSRAQCEMFLADAQSYLDEGLPTWGQYRDQIGKVHHVEFALIVAFRVEPLLSVEGHPLWGG